MLTLLFAVSALAFFGLSYYLIKRNSLYTRTGGDEYVKRQKRKLLGVTLLFPAGLLLVLAVVKYVATNPVSLPPDTVIATEPYVPPVLPKPGDDDPIVGRGGADEVDSARQHFLHALVRGASPHPQRSARPEQSSQLARFHASSRPGRPIRTCGIDRT